MRTGDRLPQCHQVKSITTMIHIPIIRVDTCFQNNLNDLIVKFLKRVSNIDMSNHKGLLLYKKHKDN